MTEEKEYVTLQISENPSINEICNVFDEATKTVNVSSFFNMLGMAMLCLYLLTLLLLLLFLFIYFFGSV